MNTGQRKTRPLRLPWLYLPEGKQQAAATAICRRVCDTEDGRAFLTLLLDDLRYFGHEESPRSSTLRAFANWFLAERLGICDKYAMVDSLMDITPKEQ